MPRMMTLFGSFRALNPKSRRQSQARTQHQIPHQLNNQTQAENDRAQNIAEIEAYTGPCHLLYLPLEIRELILCWLYDAVIVYLRTQPPDEETGIRRDDVIEWENHCAALLLVNRQLREEALHIILQNCVLDIWGSSAYNIYFLRNLPKAAGQIRNIAITFDRFHGAPFSWEVHPSLENFFIDSIPLTSHSFLERFSQYIRKPPRRHPSSSPSYPYAVIISLLSSEHQKNHEGQQPLRIFARCKTFEEETILLITDLKKHPKVWKLPTVPKFEYKCLFRALQPLAYVPDTEDDLKTERLQDEEWIVQTCPVWQIKTQNTYVPG